MWIVAMKLQKQQKKDICLLRNHRVDKEEIKIEMTGFKRITEIGTPCTC